LGYQNKLPGNAPQAQAVDVTKSSVREADDTQRIHSKSTRAISSKQTLPKQQSCASNMLAYGQQPTTAIDQCTS
jgi:hypothetical protein